MAGVPMPMIQKQVGHKRLSNTEIYATVAPALVKEAYNCELNCGVLARGGVDMGFLISHPLIVLMTTYPKELFAGIEQNSNLRRVLTYHPLVFRFAYPRIREIEIWAWPVFKPIAPAYPPPL